MKLSPLTIFLIFLSVGLAALSYGFFQMWMPNKEESGMYQTYVDQLQTEADKMPQAKKRVKEAKEMVDAEAAKWQKVVAVHTPPATLAQGGIDIGVQGWQLVVDARKYRNSIQTALNAQLRQGGVKVISGPEIPTPDESATSIVRNYFNFPFLKFPAVIFDLGAVTVQGTYEQICANVRSWSRMPNYLAVADGLRIDGTSPILTGTYNLTMVGYIRGSQVFPPVPELAGGNSAGGGGAAPGGGGGAARGGNTSPGGSTIRFGAGKAGTGGL